MATPVINTSLLAYFSPIFTFLLVFAVIYGLLQYAKLFEGNKIIHSIIAFVIAVFAGFFSTTARSMIEYMVPWFTILIIFIIFTILMYMVFGASNSDIRTVISKHSGIQWTIAIIAIVIALGALSNTFGQKALRYTNPNASNSVNSSFVPSIGHGVEQPKTSTESFGYNVGATFFHPKVAGMLFIILLGAFAVRMLTQDVTKGWP